MPAWSECEPTKTERAMADHKSDCAVHNEPALPAGPCDCGADKPDVVEAMARAIFDTAIGANHWENPWYADERAGCHYSARAALTAALDHMREPSEAMKARACEVDCPRQECAVVLACQGDGKRINKERWQAMLSQLRKEALGDG